MIMKYIKKWFVVKTEYFHWHITDTFIGLLKSQKIALQKPFKHPYLESNGLLLLEYVVRILKEADWK